MFNTNLKRFTIFKPNLGCKTEKFNTIKEIRRKVGL